MNSFINCFFVWDVVDSINPNDATRFSAYDALYIAKEGNIKIQPVHSSPIVVPVDIAPTILPFRVVKVFDTGTTIPSGGIFGLKRRRFIDSREQGQMIE